MTGSNSSTTSEPIELAWQDRVLDLQRRLIQAQNELVAANGKVQAGRVLSGGMRGILQNVNSLGGCASRLVDEEARRSISAHADSIGWMVEKHLGQFNEATK